MGLGCALSVPRCRPQSEANAQSVPADSGVIVARPDARSSRDASVITALLGNTPTLPPGWRAVDGGFVHQVTTFGPMVTNRIEESSHTAYVYRQSPERRMVEVFSATVPPSGTGVSPFAHSGHGCEPTILCEHGGRAIPRSPSGAGPRCAPRSTRQPEFSPGSSGSGTLLPEVTRQERRDHRGDVCCYEWRRFCGGGRLLVAHGELVLAETVTLENTPIDSRLADALAPWLSALSSADRAALAARWAREASFEHASVWSFDRALAELSSLGAPRSIVQQTRDARADERRHATALYGLASAIAARALGPTHTIIRHDALRSLAEFTRSLFVEACVNETIAIAHTREALAAPQIAAPVASVLESIVDDELRHMELAWKTLAWCVRVGGDEVRAVIEEELRALVRSSDALVEPQSSDELADSLAREWGLLSQSARSSVASQCARDVIVPCARALLAV